MTLGYQNTIISKAQGPRGHASGCRNYGPFLDPYYNTVPNILGYPKRDHNFDNNHAVFSVPTAGFQKFPTCKS